MADKLPADPSKRIKRTDSLTGYVKQINVKKERIAAAAATKKKVDASTKTIAGAMKPPAKSTAKLVNEANRASINTKRATIQAKSATTRAARSK